MDCLHLASQVLSQHPETGFAARLAFLLLDTHWGGVRVYKAVINREGQGRAVSCVVELRHVMAASSHTIVIWFLKALLLWLEHDSTGYIQTCLFRLPPPALNLNPTMIAALYYENAGYFAFCYHVRLEKGNCALLAHFTAIEIKPTVLGVLKTRKRRKPTTN